MKKKKIKKKERKKKENKKERYLLRRLTSLTYHRLPHVSFSWSTVDIKTPCIAR